MIRWICNALVDWTWIFLSILPIYYGYYWFIPISLLIIGTRQHALVILGHDGAHRLICKNKILNDLLTWIFAFGGLGANLELYRDFHFRHHRHLGTNEDPELEARSNVRSWEHLPTYKQAIKRFFLDSLGLGIKDFLKVSTLISIKSLFLWYTIFFLLAPFPFSLYFLAMWMCSLPTSFWGCFRLRTWTEHVDSDSTHIIEPNILERFIFLPHNTWLHYEHHEKPSIPFYNLPKARKFPSNSIADLWRK